MVVVSMKFEVPCCRADGAPPFAWGSLSAVVRRLADGARAKDTAASNQALPGVVWLQVLLAGEITCWHVGEVICELLRLPQARRLGYQEFTA